MTKKPKYKIGDIVKVINDRKIVIGKVVGVAIDNPMWIRNNPSFVYAIDIGSKLFRVKPIFPKIKLVIGKGIHYYKEHEILEEL